MSLWNPPWNTVRKPTSSSNYTYELLPSSSGPEYQSTSSGGSFSHVPRASRLWWPRKVSLRHRGVILTFIVFLAACAAGIVILVWKFSSPTRPTPTSTHDFPPPPTLPADVAGTDVTAAPPEGQARPPPLYEAYHERERHFPQHNLSLPDPEGSHAKYLWADNHGSHFGWGNYMQEMLLNAYLAFAAHRAYVFDNYTWEREGSEISSWNGHSIPARIPLSAFLSGHIVGEHKREDDIPRAVSREYYLSVCPKSERVVIDTRTVQDTLPGDATVHQIVDAWVEKLDQIDARCVELARSSPALFSYDITNTNRVLDVFPALSASPILSDFSWSPLILGEFYANIRYFESRSDSPDDAPILTESSFAPLPGLLAVHIRRGDYETWCTDAYLHSMSFIGFNSFPELPDKYVIPEVDKTHSTADITRKRCLPTIPEIVEKILAVNAPHVTRLYIMTNAKREWLAELKDALREKHEWVDGMGTSRDLELSWEGRFVSEAVDMYVGQRAERFIGNGFSSMTSNVVTLRMHNPALSPSDTHFW
ncbi:hypothetical protein R3P38DRAFT_2848631 [Favolaschia claudopus]|uniref:Uncharacterized protein n=1 Tax=Favolaschia claudopus TaxID=2862362 RepID=A0AAW0DX07_9AGAR